MVDPWAGIPAYRQVADAIRREIVDGRLRPGSRLASAADLAAEYGVGVDTVRDAVALLRAEGLLDTTPGRRTIVRQMLTRTRVPLPRHAVIRLRMPSPAEQRDYGIPTGVPVADVTTPDGETRLYIGDRDELTT